MKILFVTTVSSTTGFLVPHMRLLLSQGCRVDLACHIRDIATIELQEMGLFVHEIPFERNPFSSNNLLAYQKIRELVLEEKYDAMHVHTPVAAFVARMACRDIPGLTICYTTHGFHFYKGAPVHNWALYYTLEKIAAKWTDMLITMNREDYLTGQKMKLRRGGSVFFVNGVGVDTNRIARASVDEYRKREELGISRDAYVLVSVGELIRRKNFETSIRAFAKMRIPGSVYLICGEGPQKTELKKLARQLKIEDRVIFAGFRRDIHEILQIAKVFVFPSLQEGLPVALMEAMCAGLPVVCSAIRGNMDLIRDGVNGFLVKKD
ncbi:MAG: glycosyltransferase family 4 protein, partial [Eubacteriales bacterium]